MNRHTNPGEYPPRIAAEKFSGIEYGTDDSVAFESGFIRRERFQDDRQLVEIPNYLWAIRRRDGDGGIFHWGRACSPNEHSKKDQREESSK